MHTEIDLHAAGLRLPPDVHARLSDIEIRARRSLHAGLVGQQASRARGSGIEFAQYRAYEPGDDPRSVDWKLFARADRHFVREAERDSPLTIWLCIDASASMTIADPEAPSWSRLHAARRIAACVLEIAARQGDAVGLLVAGPQASWIPPANSRRQRDRLLHQLAILEAAGEWPPEALLAPLFARIGSGSLTLVLGDLLDASAIAGIERLAGAGRDVACVQLLSRGELEFPFHGAIRFEDPESGATVECDADAVRAGFLARFTAARRERAARLAARGVAIVEHPMHAAADQPLRRLFPRGRSR